MPTIAIIGGTGPEGRGLGLRFAMAGHQVIIGSRDAGRATEAAESLLQLRSGLPITGAANAAAARDAEWVVLSVPYDGLATTVEALALQLADKLVVSVVAPLAFDRGRARPVAVPDGSAGQQVAGLLPTSQVVSAFHHLSAHDLLNPAKELEGDILVCGDSDDAKRQVMALAEQVRSLRAVDIGTLDNSRYLEELTALLLGINRMHRARVTIRLLGL
jgi:NADPH-dependent F420 reductase